MTSPRSLLPLLLGSSLLAACVAPAPGDGGDGGDATAAIDIHPCAFVRAQLLDIAEGAGATLAANGAAGWSVFVARRPTGQTEPCVGTASGGFARSHLDGYRAFTPDVSFPIASQSKVITAVATTDILARRGVARSASIAPYLPSHWILGPGVTGITFAQLLTHTSGLAPGSLAGGWGSDLEGDLRLWLQVGVVAPAKPYSYANAGMALLQLLAARVEYGSGVYAVPDKLAFSGSLLAGYVTSNLLDPYGIPAAGTPGPSCTFDSGGAFAYPAFSAPTVYGDKLSTATDLRRCGFGWWQFTARNLGLFLDRLWNGDLLGGRLTHELISNNYGFDPTSADYLTKGGLLPAGDAQFKSKTYMFPDGTVAVAFVNSDSAIGTAVPDAYDAVMSP